VIVTEYMRETRRVSKEIEEKALRYISLGYQKLLTFETSSGGFSWFGGPPGNVQVTAYGLMEFTDMARVSYVDPDMISRTIDWVVSQQRADGSWFSTPTHGSSAYSNNTPLRATAYVTYALGEAGYHGAAASQGVAFIKANLASATDVFDRALCANALLVHDVSDAEGRALLTQLYAERTEDATTMSWPCTGSCTWYSMGNLATLETTAYVAWAMLKTGGYSSALSKIATFITGCKDSMGNYGSTYATVLSLKTLMAIGVGGGPDLTLSISVNGGTLGTVTIDESNADALWTFDLDEHLVAGQNRIDFSYTGSGKVEYHMGGSYFLPWNQTSAPADGIGLVLTHDRTTCKAGEPVQTTIRLQNPSVERPIFMPVAQISLPPGFVPVREDLETLVTDGTVEKYELNDGGITFYISELAPEAILSFSFRSLPGIAGEFGSGRSSAYEYYSPSVRAGVEPVTFTVTDE
jgi:hypothetical protein